MNTCKELPSLNALLGIPEPTRADQIHSAKVRIEEIEGDIKNLSEEADRLRQEAREYEWSMNWQQVTARLKATLRIANTALESAQASLVEHATLKADNDKFDDTLRIVNGAIYLIKELNLPK